VTALRCPVVELRQYTLRPGQRDVLIELFDREFVESQEETGMAILGQFRDLDAPDRFVWLRGFAGMESRLEALTRFYGGPVWKAHAAQANATMVDVDDVLLLRPTSASSGFPTDGRARPPVGATVPPPSRVLASVHLRDRPVDDEFRDHFDRAVRPALADAGATPIACLETEYAENTFPALAVRAGEHAFVWFTWFAGDAQLTEHLRRLAWPAGFGPVRHLRLAPTARSLLR